jgi:hypothetical protein
MIGLRGGTAKPPCAWRCLAAASAGATWSILSKIQLRRTGSPKRRSALFAMHDFGGQGEDGRGVGVDLVS